MARSRANEVDTLLGTLEDPTADEVARLVDEYDAGDVAAAAAKRALGAGGGGSLPDGWTVDDPGSGDLSANGGGLYLGGGSLDTGGGNLALGGGAASDLKLSGDADADGNAITNIAQLTGTGEDWDTGGGQIIAGDAEVEDARISGKLDHNGTQIGFNGAAPVVAAELPAVGVVVLQDLVDFLVLRGDVTQAAP